MQDRPIKVESIKLSIGNKEVELSVKEAEELHSKLGELFRQRNVTVVQEIKYIPINMPSITPAPYYPQWGTICGGLAGMQAGCINGSNISEHAITTSRLS